MPSDLQPDARPLHVSFAPYVPTGTSPFAGHKFYYQFLTAISRHASVIVIAPNTIENVEASQDPTLPYSVLLTAPANLATGALSRFRRHFGVWGLHELRPLPSLSSEVETICARARSFDLHWSEALPLSGEISRFGRPIAGVEQDIFWTTLTVPPGLSFRANLAARLSIHYVRRQETRALRKCDFVVAFKEQDLDTLRHNGVKTRGTVVRPPLDKPSGPLNQVNRSILFVGAFGRRENSEGALWFVEEVLPLVRSSFPDVAVVFAGSGASEELRARAERAGVIVTGFVDDLDPIYRSSTLAIAPIHHPGGLRIKVPQAMIYGLPVVATTAALSGLPDFQPDLAVKACDAPKDFADGICKVLGDPGYAAAVGKYSQRYASSHFPTTPSFPEILKLLGY